MIGVLLSSGVIRDSCCVYRAGDRGWVTQGKSTHYHPLVTYSYVGIPSSPTSVYGKTCGEYIKPYMCVQTPLPHPLHLLRAMRVVETPSSRRSEACDVTCHVKFGVSCQIIPQLILTRGRLIQPLSGRLNLKVSVITYPRSEIPRAMYVAHLILQRRRS